MGSGTIRTAAVLVFGVAIVAGGGAVLAQVAVPEDRARAAALAALPGTVLETEMDRYGGRVAYEFKVQPQAGGRAVDVHVDVLTAAVLGTGEDTEPDLKDGRSQTGGAGVRTAALRASAEPEFQTEFDVANRSLVDTGESRYFVLQPGFKTVLSDGETTLTITVLNETRIIDGVSTRVVEERQETAGVPDEVALNFFALDPATGDAFYFGEEVDMFSSGQLTGHPGTWLATNGNRPGLIMPGSPVVGMRYYQELAPNMAMDRAEVLTTGNTCATPAGEFSACVVTRETSAIETADERKAYAPGIGLIQDENLLLVSYEYVDPGR
jgi:hypothetical protein